jgi:hypothetical protein
MELKVGLLGKAHDSAMTSLHALMAALSGSSGVKEVDAHLNGVGGEAKRMALEEVSLGGDMQGGLLLLHAVRVAVQDEPGLREQAEALVLSAQAIVQRAEEVDAEIVNLQVNWRLIRGSL